MEIQRLHFMFSELWHSVKFCSILAWVFIEDDEIGWFAQF